MLLKIARRRGRSLLQKYCLLANHYHQYDCLITLFNEKCSIYLSQYSEDATQLYQKLSDLIWYISPQVGKYKLRGAGPPKFFEPLFQFNNPTRSKHGVGKISKFILLSHIESVTTLLEKSFVYRKSFQNLRVEIDKLIESCVKYSDYLAQNMSQVQESQLDENDPSYVNVLKTLPYFEGNICEGYSKKEVVVIQSILEKLDSLDIFEPLNIDTFLPSAHHQHYRILNNIKEQGLPRYNNSLFSQEYGSSLGYTYFIWKEVEEESREAERCSVIESIKAKLPKYFSHVHKQKAKKTLSLLMMDKITPAQFRSIYHELTGDACFRQY